MASTDDIDYRTKVGSKSWETRHDEETKQLSAWRRLHDLLPHEDIVKTGAKPTDDSEKLAAIAEFVEKIQEE